jgi:hypothetical protein
MVLFTVWSALLIQETKHVIAHANFVVVRVSLHQQGLYLLFYITVMNTESP